MKKKVLIIGIVIVLLIVIYGIIFFVDYNNVSNGKLPAFAIKSDTENYHGLGYTVNVKYYKDTNNIETINMSVFGKTIAGMVQSIEEQAENQNIEFKDNTANQGADIYLRGSNLNLNTTSGKSITFNGGITGESFAINYQNEQGETITK